MGLDEYIFGLFSNYWKNKKRKAAAQDERSIHLRDLKARLSIVARAITGRPVMIFPAQKEGGYRDDNFFLPVYFAAMEDPRDNFNFYLFRTLFLCIQQRLNLNWQDGQEHSLEDSRRQAQQYAKPVLDILFAEFPVMREIHDKLFIRLQNEEQHKAGDSLSMLYGKWMLNKGEQNDEQLNHFNEKVKKAIHDEIETILQANPVEEVKTQQVDKKQQQDQVVHNYYEKIETLEEHQGGIWKDFDGDDELEEHQNALDELTMSHTVRVDDDTHSIYQAEFVENITVAESREKKTKQHYLLYDEWDFAKRKYKKDFCKVFPKSIIQKDPAYYKQCLQEHASTLNVLRKMLANLNNRYQELKRQTQGENIDIDAVTDFFIDTYAGRTPSEKIYLSKRKLEKDISIMLLLDVSLSSDGYANGNRVIDVEKKVSILFGEILQEFNVDFSIHAFFSKTRNYSTYITLKGFDENWSLAKDKIGSVDPQGYTRIGAALRHSGSLLRQRQSKNKWLILISDGKPNDYDRYEGKYGIQDVKQALRELRQNNIHSYALAIEAEAKYYLPQMFGVNHYQILTTPVELLESLVKLYEKIKHQ